MAIGTKENNLKKFFCKSLAFSALSFFSDLQVGITLYKDLVLIVTIWVVKENEGQIRSSFLLRFYEPLLRKALQRNDLDLQKCSKDPRQIWGKPTFINFHCLMTEPSIKAQCLEIQCLANTFFLFWHPLYKGKKFGQLALDSWMKYRLGMYINMTLILEDHRKLLLKK